MSSEDQAILAGGEQPAGSNDDEVASKYFTKKENVNSYGDTVGPAAEQVNSNVDSTDLTLEQPDDTVHVDQIENSCAEECPKEMATELNDSLPETLENHELESTMIVQTNSSVEELQTPEAVDLEAKTSCDIEQSLEKVNSNVDNTDLTVGKPDDAAHVDQTGNNCEEECPKEMATETTENPELETNMIVQTNGSIEELQTPEAVHLEAKTSGDSEQSLDTEAVTLNIEGLGTSEEGQIQYTPDDFRSPESVSDMERETYENMSTNADYEEVDDLSASTSNTGQWKKAWHKKGERKENRKKNEKSKLVKRFSDRDTENYRNGYPGKEDDESLNDNIRFYKGERASSPDGAFIDDIHKNWKGNYKLLERHHGYIQWLFPIRESGMNWQAQPLQLHEAEAIKADPKASKRVLESYKLMLDFYGMQLANEATGELERSTNWEQCFDNLNWSSHNFLRITRILKCLGELGYEHLKKGFIKFVLVEALEHHTLEKTVGSCRDYWIGTLKSDQDREELYDYIDSFKSKNIRIGAPDLVVVTFSGLTRTFWVGY